MDEVDIDDADDLNELEARLYAQIHHEPSGNCDFSATYKEASAVRRQVTATSVINNKSTDRTRIGRYWNEKPNVRISAQPSVETQLECQQSIPSTSGETKKRPTETVDNSFRPPVKTLSNLRANPFASGNGPTTKGSSSQTRNKNVFAAKSKKKIDSTEHKGPFARQLTKLDNAVKYDAKKQKAKAAKAKMKKVPAIGPIELLSSNESEIDDVIEVPLPSPKIVTIDSSSDECNPAEEQTNFIKPQTSAVRDSSSRCTSPGSVVSDDFIGQNDRSRLLEEDDKPDDEDLLMLQEDVDTLMETPEGSINHVSELLVDPTRDALLKTPTDYRVTQKDFRALDVYESESDIQESVYSKGLKSTKPSIVVRLENESSSDDDIVEVDIAQKTKRLRKRRASSSNKGSETYIDSTDSEQENTADNEGNRSSEGVVRTRVPFIALGEAIEGCILNEQPFRKNVVNSSDNEFIATLNTLAQGTSTVVVTASGNETDEEDEQVTARALAENVIQRENRSIAEPVINHDEEANDAIPDDSLKELNQVFEKIDKMDNRTENIDSDDSDQSVELIAPLPVLGRNWPQKKKLENATEDPVYNIVYCEDVKFFGGIGWNEEMQKFYNNSWKGERFNVKAICSQMKTTKSLWKIYTEDRFPKYTKRSNQKCMNCCEFGHIRARCPKPRKPALCYMCGENGHHEPRCPNTVCLRCGNKTRMFTKSCNSCNYQNRLICPICKVRGHNINLCPDKWRRYHSTTKPNEYPNNKIEYKNRKFCCICGFRGHLAEHCRHALRCLEYPVFISEIRSHQKSYDDLSVKTIRSGIGYNLMYKPEEDLCFELAENQTRQNYYGRFLIAVGMGHLLKRKRKADVIALDEPVEKQQKTSTPLKEYVVNPFAKKALDKSSSTLVSLVDDMDNSSDDLQIVEVSTSERTTPINKQNISSAKDPMNIDEENALQSEPSTSTGLFKPLNITSSFGEENVPPQRMREEYESNVELNNSTFKTPDVSSTSAQTQKQNVLEVMDSDSNYSFSEHFDIAQEKANPGKSREMESLPDFIPITNDGDVSPDEDKFEMSRNFGISAGIKQENSNIDMDCNSISDIPCEAKIYLTNFYGKFLLAPEGNKFLVERSEALNIKANVSLTSVGHILIIFGLRCNQDQFYRELLFKFRDLSDKLNRKQLESSQKIPKKTEALIRFLREHLNQLQTNLGNVNDLIKRLSYQENQRTKSGWKSAEKTRRSLNMILIGQAGLRNGSKHLDQLLSHLRNLIDEYKEDTVSNEIRDEIDSHWKLIFSSYRHEKYHDLIDAYNHMQIKNRLQNININARLLGKKVLDTTLSKAQKEKMDKWPDTHVEAATIETKSPAQKVIPNSVSTKYQARQAKTPMSEKKRIKNVSTTSPSVSQTVPNNQKQEGATVSSPVVKKIKAVNAEWEAKCVNLLTEIDSTKRINKDGLVRDSKAASMFWSREAIKYIDECIQLGKSNKGILEKLSRVQQKSQKGLLSYNDYRAIIKIHNAIKSKQ